MGFQGARPKDGACLVIRNRPSPSRVWQSFTCLARFDLIRSRVRVMWLVSHLLSILGFVLALVLIARILRERRPPGSTLGWLVTIVMAPYVGVPLYLFFGGRKTRRLAARKKNLQLAAPTTSVRQDESAIQRVLRVAGMPDATGGNRIELLATGEASFLALIDLIRTAQKSIQIATFILGSDDTGRLVLEELEKKAAGGVRVQLLLDGLFAMRASHQGRRALKNAGGEICYFMPILHLPFHGHSNLRNHRKIVVVDGLRGMIGGMNITLQDMGSTPFAGRWRDLSIRVEGRVVEQIAALFLADWDFALGRNGEPQKLPSVSQESRDSSIQMVASGPDVPGDAFYDGLLTALFEANRRIWIATPYFVPDETLARSLVLAAKRGVDVRILVPARSNHWVADLVAASYMREVREAGGRLCLYRGGMMHAKVSIIDSQVATVGSANMDIRSLFLNYEIALFLYSRPDIDRLANWYESALADCDSNFPAPTTARLLAEDLGRLLAPIT